jgi:hypothetical protein
MMVKKLMHVLKLMMFIWQNAIKYQIVMAVSNSRVYQGKITGRRMKIKKLNFYFKLKNLK